MRLLLIFSLFFTSAMDACYAETLVQAAAHFMGIDDQDPCLDSHHDCKPDFSGSQNSHDQHESSESCSSCHYCHVWISVKNPFHGFSAIPNSPNSTYSFSLPFPYSQELFRPPILIS